MKLLIDDTTGREHGLNANETCVYAAILKCTKAGRGWFANYRDLAAALPFVVSRMTVTRAVEKLFNLGLIERRDNILFAHAQIEHNNAQIEHVDAQNEHDNAQIEQKIAPPNNPLIINENMNETKNATCAQTCDTRTSDLPTFLDLKKEFSSKGGGGMTTHMEMQAVNEWNKCSPAKKFKLLEAVRLGAHFKPRLDWLIADFPEPQPTFLSGQEQDRMSEQGIPLVQVKYNGKFLICTRETMNLFHLEWNMDWLPRRD